MELSRRELRPGGLLLLTRGRENPWQLASDLLVI
jgi:hypothetical protein